MSNHFKGYSLSSLNVFSTYVNTNNSTAKKSEKVKLTPCAAWARSAFLTKELKPKCR